MSYTNINKSDNNINVHVKVNNDFNHDVAINNNSNIASNVACDFDIDILMV